ncbi:hypothetical protein BDP55DRAFT_631850 [Colletotrichum godetiae]|uniref:Uncharacterized protein n=1 Tax=Colletotrichum godetiae TaxID=1209918 RepID=A0AAJ0EVT7_9PEZI|nr:uncharacterized protein BDP55DRAFT_631850 [Colletotrichum godetiae]KAK1675653.1 hypothetical protein BDP55DRAFT_631850 [Colletotrichum godetiae]
MRHRQSDPDTPGPDYAVLSSAGPETDALAHASAQHTALVFRKLSAMDYSGYSGDATRDSPDQDHGHANGSFDAAFNKQVHDKDSWEPYEFSCPFRSVHASRGSMLPGRVDETHHRSAPQSKNLTPSHGNWDAASGVSLLPLQHCFMQWDTVNMASKRDFRLVMTDEETIGFRRGPVAIEPESPFPASSSFSQLPIPVLRHSRPG